MTSIGFNMKKENMVSTAAEHTDRHVQNEISHFMRLYGCYGYKQVVVKYTEGESKVTADNVNADNFLRIKMHLLDKEMNGH